MIVLYIVWVEYKSCKISLTQILPLLLSFALETLAGGTYDNTLSPTQREMLVLMCRWKSSTARNWGISWSSRSKNQWYSPAALSLSGVIPSPCSTRYYSHLTLEKCSLPPLLSECQGDYSRLQEFPLLQILVTCKYLRMGAHLCMFIVTV